MPRTRSRNTTSARPIRRLKTANFSGGNQQKIVLAREMEQDPGVLIVGQPTRGVDIGAIEFIHKRLIAMRDQGKAVLLVSVELDEIRSLSDRILVMFAGRIVGERGPDATEGELGLLMAGVERQEAARMSTPYAKLPAWADYGLIPLINLSVAFIVAGFVVLLVGENPFRAAVILVEAPSAREQASPSRCSTPPTSSSPGFRWRSPRIAACSTSAPRARPISPASASPSSA